MGTLVALEEMDTQWGPAMVDMVEMARMAGANLRLEEMVVIAVSLAMAVRAATEGQEAMPSRTEESVAMVDPARTAVGRVVPADMVAIIVKMAIRLEVRAAMAATVDLLFSTEQGARRERAEMELAVRRALVPGERAVMVAQVQGQAAAAMLATGVMAAEAAVPLQGLLAMVPAVAMEETEERVVPEVTGMEVTGATVGRALPVEVLAAKEEALGGQALLMVRMDRMAAC